jgi:hypothetical protein
MCVKVVRGESSDILPRAHLFHTFLLFGLQKSGAENIPGFEPVNQTGIT